MNPTQPRMFPDFAAAPTRTERAGARRFWQHAQTTLALTVEAEHEPTACAACGGEHETERCPHGIAVPMELI